MEIQNKSLFAELQHISLDQFFPLICDKAHRHEIIWQKREKYEIIWRVFHCARTIIDDWDCNFLEMGTHDDFFKICDPMYQNWSFERMDPLLVELTPNVHRLVNGHHRAFSLGCLLIQKKVDFQPIPVLNLAKLHFDTSSDTPIKISYSAEEFLAFSKLQAGGTPIGEVPQGIRLTDIKLYERILTDASQRWKDLISAAGFNHAHIRARLHIRDNTLLFDDIVIEEADANTAIDAAFIADAVLNGIQAGTVFFPLFNPLVEIPPPYIHQ